MLYMVAISKNRDARSLDHGTLEEMRRLGVRRVLAGESQVSVAESLEVSKYTVSKWMRKYREKGAKALDSTKATGRRPTLEEHELKKLRRLVIGKNPSQLNFGPALWTLHLVGELIDDLFHVVLHKTTVSRLLGRLGITPQKPTRQAFQRDDEQVQHWMTTEFPAIVKEAKKKQAALFFLDESQLREDATVGRTWGEKGKTPVVKVSGTRRRINVISAVSPNGRLWFRCFDGGLTAERFEQFLKDMLKGRKKHVVIVTDRHPAHRSARVMRYLSESSARISMHFLPSYAPDLNPDEHVWCALKALFKQDPLDPSEQIQPAVEKAMEKIKKDRSWVESFFDHPAVKYVKQALGWR